MIRNQINHALFFRGRGMDLLFDSFAQMIRNIEKIYLFCDRIGDSVFDYQGQRLA